MKNLLLFVSILFYSTLSFAKYERYSFRPGIVRDVKAQYHPELNTPTWVNLKKGHLEVVAEILEMYNDRDIYFLARDAEFLFDYAQLALDFSRKVGDVNRLHLINISRDNFKSPNIRSYLGQEGIREDLLASGKKILFVDTGYSGSIPRVLGKLFSENARSNILTHLLASTNEAHPSSRVFLSSCSRYAGLPYLDNPDLIRDIISQFEALPKFMDRSTGFKYYKGNGYPFEGWDAVSWEGWSRDGVVSKPMALAYMEDLKFYAQQNRQRLQWERGVWKTLKSALISEPIETEPSKRLTQALQAVLRTQDPYAEFIVRDFYDIVKTNYPKDREKLPPLYVLNLKGLVIPENGNKNQFPQWRSILDVPLQGLTKLVQENNFQTFREIVETVDDLETRWATGLLLGDPNYDSTTHASMRSMMKVILQKGEQRWLRQLARMTFSQSGAAEWNDELKELIVKGDQFVWANLAKSAFVNEFAKGWKEEFYLMLEKVYGAALSAIRFHQEEILRWYSEGERKIILEALEIDDIATRTYILRSRRYYLQNPPSASEGSTHEGPQDKGYVN